MNRTVNSCRSALSALTLVGAVCGAWPVVAAAPGSAGTPATHQAPDFSFTDLSGASHSLAEFHGKVVLLEFWASWCSPCRKGFPFLDMLQARHGAAGLQVVAVTLETDREAVRSFVTKRPGTFLVGEDPSGRAGELYEVAAMPTAILLDRQGQIAERFEGGDETVHGQMLAAVDSVMRGVSPVPTTHGPRPKKGPLGSLKAWERGYLADPIMNLDGDSLTRSIREHIHASKEAAAGDGGVAGGGCGCN